MRFLRSIMATWATVCAVVCVSPSAGAQVGHSARGLTAADVESAGSLPQTTTNLGQLPYTIPIEVPAARGGKVTPTIGLSYQSGAPASYLGRGWRLPQTYIELDFMRRTPNGPSAIDPDSGLFSDARSLYVDGDQRKPLVHAEGSTYRMAVENRFISFTQTADGWQAIDGALTRYHFRMRQQDHDGLIFRWYLSWHGPWVALVLRTLVADIPGVSDR
jgi:hypothetical protein